MVVANENTEAARGHFGGLITVPRAAALGFLLLTLVTAGTYGFYGDELYYIACGKHLDWGYVDHPPMVALLTLIGTSIFGETIVALRFMAGLAGAITVLLSAHVARVLGGRRTSQSLAALSVCCAPAFPALSSFFSMNPIDVMLCTLFLVAFLGAITTPSPPKWIAVGVLFGTGLLNKYTFLVLGFSVLLSLIMTKRWEVLRSRWLYISGAVALVMFLPHLLWQINNGWPTLEFIHNATEFKNLLLSPIAFMSQLVIGLNPLTLPLWLSGVLYLLFSKETKERRFLGWTAVVFILVYLLQNSKFFYVLPVFPVLLGSGAVACERFSQNYRFSWPTWVVGVTMTVSGALLMPLAVPLLPVDQFVSYAKTLGLWDAVRMQKNEGDALPIHIVYRFGWEEVVDATGAAFNALPQHEKDRCAILASWYGIAGAIDHFGATYGLPGAICPNNSYWMWGTHSYSGDVVLAVGYDAHSLEEYFASVERVASVNIPYAYEVEIYLCKRPKGTLDQLWPTLRRLI